MASECLLDVAAEAVEAETPRLASEDAVSRRPEKAEGSIVLNFYMKGGTIAQRRDAMMRAHILSKVRQRTDAEINSTFYTPEEIASHASMDDAWMSYRGKVYDITHYVRYHPGGLQCMQEYMGKDMTHAADSVHKWVNVATMLRPLAIGTVKTHVDNSNAFSCLPTIAEVAEEENNKDAS